MLHKLKKRIQKVSRDNKQNQFYSIFSENQTVLDVGVHGEVSKNMGLANHFLRTFKYDPANYTGLGIEDMSVVQEKYPKMRFVQYPGGRFPFKDKEFDWAYSNAVIEHVGDDSVKIDFIKEMCRVAKSVFFTTPNKYFPIDSHTMVFFIHWNDKRFAKWRQKNDNWWPLETLNLISLKQLKYLLYEAGVENYRIKKNRVLGMSMTFTVVISKEGT